MEKEKSNVMIPLAILGAGLLIAGAVFFTRDGSSLPLSLGTKSPSDIQVTPVTEKDHILGNPQAKVVIVEYSDLECPFCKTFHSTLHQVVSQYGENGDVAWVFRSFPLAQLHSQAPKEAEAAECAADQGGNAAFWKFIDRVFDVTPSNNGLDLAQLPKIAQALGLNVADFNTCLSSGRYAEKVKNSYEDAYKTAESASLSGVGTPFSLIISGNQIIPVEGAQPYGSVKAVLDSLITGASSGAQAVPSLAPKN